MVIVDAFTHYTALNPVPHCNAYYAYTTLYEHWIGKFGFLENLVTYIERPPRVLGELFKPKLIQTNSVTVLITFGGIFRA